MRFASLGSGSRGNATLIEAGGTRVLIDCGFSLRETERRLGRLGLQATNLDALLVTHEHDDHVGGIGPLARRHQLPVWLTAGTRAAAGAVLGDLPVVRLLPAHTPFSIGDLLILPVPIPHDAREPTQFVFSDGRLRVGLLTDTGAITPHIRSSFATLDALLLEFNHDRAMLQRGPYPESLKLRIGNGYGHLSNEQSADLLAQINTARLQHLVAMHLSQQNNSAERVIDAAARALGCTHDWIAIADQDSGIGWRTLV